MSPLLACAYLVADEVATDQTRTAAGMWVNNAFNAGSSGGYAAMGPTLSLLPLGWCFALAAAPILLGAAAARALRSRAGRQEPPPVATEVIRESAGVSV